jgi:geranylgeranyl diphosphate synthase type II
LAFQLQDDYLDTFGDQSVFGKRIGNDILTNKKTYLLVKALELSEGVEKEKLQQLMMSREIDEKGKIKQVTAIYKHLFIGELTKKKIRYLHKNSLAHLSRVKVQDDRKAILVQLAKRLITRDK